MDCSRRKRSAQSAKVAETSQTTFSSDLLTPEEERELLTSFWDCKSELVRVLLRHFPAELRAVNEALWRIEDDIRLCERAGDFGPRFVELARSVYRTNDRRSELKRRINELLGSGLVEEKSYAAYLAAPPEPAAPPRATVCILTYGDYLPYFRRCLESVLARTPPEAIELRFGFNQAAHSFAHAL